MATMLACGTAWMSAAAQDDAPLDVTVVEELVARPLNPGPAWWRVADADSSVWIMTEPFTTPKGFSWDQSVLQRRLDGANLYISPFDFSLLDPRSIVGMGGALLNAPRLMLAPKAKPEPRPVGPLEDRLAPDLRERFVATREKLSQPAERYAAMTPMEAAQKIAADYRQRFPTAEFAVHEQAEATAKRMKVRVTPAYRVRVPTSGYKVEVLRMDFSHGAACLGRALDDIDRQWGQTERVARAWAQGDVRPMLVRGSPFAPPKPAPAGQEPKCMNGGAITVDANGALARRLDEEYVASQVTVIERALKQPGRSVALLPLMSPFGNVEAGLLGRKGVLERLKGKGYEITLPEGL